MEYKLEIMLQELGYSVQAQIGMMSKLEETNREYGFVMSNAIQHDLFNIILKATDTSKRFASTGNIILLSDRYYVSAIGLQYYFTKYTSLTVLGVAHDLEHALHYSENNVVDLLIIMGFQCNEKNYEAIRILRDRDGTNIIMWALQDLLISDICRSHNILSSFSSHRPLDEFVEYIEQESLLIRKQPVVVQQTDCTEEPTDVEEREIGFFNQLIKKLRLRR